ncbi:MAG TPA: response regulator transcription factor [Thermoanaerobaculia bacterium]|jgi:DNA-binding NarL/FixJ family response regulator
MRILIADDHPLFRDGLKSLLQAEGHEVIGEARDGGEAVELAKRLHPEMVLMDVSMPNVDGLAATRTLVSEMPEVKVIILTASDDDAKLFDAIKAGAQGYLLKNLEADDFFSLLDRASRGEPALTPNLARKLLQEFAKPQESAAADNPDALTVREREVLELMVEGITSNRKLAKRLNVTENTVKFHVRNILDKLRLHTRAEAVGYALRNKIVDPHGS